MNAGSHRYPSGKEKDYKQPVFILSCARSGSTLLRIIQDTHSEICSPGELALGSLCGRLGEVIGHLTKRQNAGRPDRQAVWSQVREIASRLMDSYASAQNKRIWCEKTPSNTKYLEVLDKVFPDAEYVCLHRNCLDVVHSFIEGSRYLLWPEVGRSLLSDAIREGESFNVLAAAIDVWIEAADALLRFEADNPTRCIRIKYESLVNDPAGTLRPL